MAEWAGRKVGLALYWIIATALSQYLTIELGWTSVAGKLFWAVEIWLWFACYVFLSNVYWGMPAKVPGAKKLAGSVAIFVLAYIVTVAFGPIWGWNTVHPYVQVHYTCWVLVFILLFAWLGL